MARKGRTSAYKAFAENMQGVKRLFEIHVLIGGIKPGRRWGSEVLNKSAVVLLVACWEAYLEDVASVAFDAILSVCTRPRQFPKEVTKRVGQNLRDAKDERKIWEIAGDGWKSVLSDHKAKAIKNFHNPTSNSVDEFFFRVLGMKDVSKCWHWTGMSAEKAMTKLDRIVDVRGSIAHRVQHSSPVHKSTVRSYREHVIRLVRKTDAEIRRRLRIL